MAHILNMADPLKHDASWPTPGPIWHPNLRQGAKSEARNRFLGVLINEWKIPRHPATKESINPYTQKRPRRKLKQASFYGKYH